MRTFIENYLHLMKNCIRPHYEKLKPLKSGFIENSNFENNRDPWSGQCGYLYMLVYFHLYWWWWAVVDCTQLYWAVLECSGLYLVVLGCGGP